ncbi:checkpoint serine/threonine-protein kinase [Talaromyces islandicus]|uniref:Checkpoint serine/threonine-protein kinase n=1 Tax=Talaromyces islandicus TaxID=28573 RepID=A0A0U1M6M1_TALIS|nr:checkpoint serine/threonine-protein kinase [Talaromyces islandicus]
MSASEDLINFDVIETQKENIQSLPGGRSAKALAQIFSSGSNGDKYASPSPNETRTLNDAIRQEYEAEIEASADSDDPLDVYDRYVKWTMNAYPSTQATAESGLLSLLERATKAFLNSTHYKNDPRYLRLWLQYIRLFSDAPREIFAFLSRHNIGQGLALFYEEFAAWLEGAGRWVQAEEVYKLGLEREARPQERLLRKFGEFQSRFEQRPRGSDGPSSPALPTVRAALAAKVDPFATARTPADPQAPQSRGVGGGTTKKSGKPKMAIFADSDGASPQPAAKGEHDGSETMGWRDYEVRKASGTGAENGYIQGRDYKDPTHEVCLEELRASHRGWLKKDWSKSSNVLQVIPTNAAGRALEYPETNNENLEPDLTDELKQKLTIEGRSSHHGDRDGKLSKVKKIKVREINETQTIKTNLDSPAKPKIKRKNVREPTMTIHTRAATDEIYSIFNQPLKSETAGADHGDSLFDSEFEDDDYTSAGESTVTSRMSAGTSEFGDDDTNTFQRGNEDDEDDEDEDVENDGDWTEFTASKHIPQLPAETPRADEYEDSIRHRYIPEMPDNYNPPVGMYRDAAIMAQNRLPFMTPIIEQTESSLPSFTAAKSRLYDTKTPCKTVPEVDYTPSGSPVGDLLLPTPDAAKAIPHLPEIQSPSPAVKTLRRTPVKKSSSPKPADFAAIIKEEQCDPTDIGIRKKILKSAEPPLTTYVGYHDNSSIFGAHASGIQKYSKTLKRPAKSGDKSSFHSPVLEFPNANRAYAIRRELGAGAYAPVYLAESVQDGTKKSHHNVQRQGLEAIKMETDPPNAWEFYMIRTAQDRIAATPSLSRAADSIVRAHELHIFKDESFLIEDYRGQGTLLDLVNIIRTEAMTTTGNAEAGMDEALSMFFAVELFRTIEALHTCGILHGDVKPDNCLVRFDSTKNYSSSSSLPSPPSESLLSLGDENAAVNPSEAHYSARGHCGWRERGLMLIDFGRGVDMKAFRPDVKFVAEWEMSQHDCTEVREMRPWTYQIDLYGVAVTIHAMLFGKYLECVPVDPRNLGSGGRDSFNDNNNQAVTDDDGDNLSKHYRVRESFKRYWDREIWTDVFDLLLNPCSQRWTKMERQQQQQENTSSDDHAAPASPLPVLNSMKHVREKMEAWLTVNAEKKGLAQQIRKLETHLWRRKERLERDR